MNAISRPRPAAFQPETVIPLGHLVVLCVLALAAATWGWVVVAAPANTERFGFLAVLAVYGTGSALFVASRMREGRFQLFDIPTFITVLAFVEFGLAPLACFLGEGVFDPAFHGMQAPFFRSLAWSALGMTAFWAGCRAAASLRGDGVGSTRGAVDETASSAPIGPPVIWALAMYAVAFVVKAYLLENFGYDYGASPELYTGHLAAMQVATVIFQLGTYSLVILAIERSFHRFSLERNVIFWIVFVLECFWGLVSGMKSNLLQNFFLVAVVSSMAERRLKTRWVAAAVLGLVIIYPFSIRYRDLVRTRPDEAMGVSGAESIATAALDEAASSDSTAEAWLRSGFEASVSRVNLLQNFAAVLTLGPKSDWLRGGERWWMLPFYPFVPRFLWRSKPVLDKGRRFSVAMGSGSQTSTALTYPGDLYLGGGLPGLLAGMLLLGLAACWLTARYRVAGNKSRTFVYTGLLMAFVYGIEMDAFDFWSTLIRTLAILSIVAWAVYRPDSNTRRRARQPA